MLENEKNSNINATKGYGDKETGVQNKSEVKNVQHPLKMNR